MRVPWSLSWSWSWTWSSALTATATWTWPVLFAACGAETRAPETSHRRTETVAVADHDHDHDNDHDRDHDHVDVAEPTREPTQWQPIPMPPALDQQIRARLERARRAPFRILRWLVFDHADGRASAYVVYEQSRHDACNALSRAYRTSKTPSEARSRFENECVAQSTVPLEDCRFAGLARFAIRGDPASPSGLDLEREEVLDPELCSLSFSTFALRDLDGDPLPELLVDFEWQDLVSGSSAGPAPTKKVHALLVFRADLTVQESRTVGAEYFEEGNRGDGAQSRGTYRLEDVDSDGHPDLIIEKETVEHCRGCRSTRERLVLRYDAGRDEWR